ncbi:MAG: LOG family protein [Drouetiella hepatica Uher 2000/2452]|jgi:hypothetical protein|uniref:LOG family protein n=1 Tax=Drouetiella hepatica Uher 2000/2452 TaxID=904376 RepID=A0A951QH51_9CYAN|nr:LOG family protein [Drouetiella hepatica Uher 2000/2452]
MRYFCVLGDVEEYTGIDFVEMAGRLAFAMAREGIGLVCEDGSSELTRRISGIITENGVRVIRVSSRSPLSSEGAEKSDGRVAVSELHEYKTMIFTLSDSFVVLPGGVSTLDLLMEYLTWMPRVLGRKPVYIVNAAGYWSPLLQMFEKMRLESFLPDDFHARYTEFADVECIVPNFLATLLSRTSPARFDSGSSELS